MRSIRSTKQRLDYSELHSTGIRKNHPEPGMPPAQDASSKLVLYKSTLADIIDFMEENQLDETNVHSEDPDAIIKRLESLRTTLRVYHIELKTSHNLFEEEYGSVFQETIQQIKEFIKDIKSVKVQVHSKSQKMKLEESNLQTRADSFQISELQHTINRMIKEITVSVSKLSNAEVIRRERDIPEMRKRLDAICSQLKHLLSHSPSLDLNEVSKNYDQLKRIFNPYLTAIIAEYDDRDIETSKTFKASNINIKLPVFNGYKSSVDIYRFQSDFEKVHAKRTPKNCLPDLLKHNYLGEPALSLVKHLDDIQEIWDRLKSSFGSPKTLLQRKLNELNSINQLFRARDPERLANGFAMLITMMKDLTILSSEHGIEQHLYCSNAIERIYAIIGDSRVTRWLDISCEKEFSDKQHWNEFILFLEKELKVQQEKHLIQQHQPSILQSQQSTDQRRKANDERKTLSTKGNYYESHQAQHLELEDQKQCSICDEFGHTQTNGPRGSKLIQYFACQQFAKMSPSERYQTLKKKGLCCQCLYPGASQLKGKHQEGNCQRDFVCKHPSHEKYTTKKHVLVCEEHASSDENKKLLHEYKSRCILRQKNELPDYSKDIKLSFHSNSDPMAIYHSEQFASTYSTSSSQGQQHLEVSQSRLEDVINERAIYILQTIKVAEKRYTLFYDTGCSDMLIRVKAVKTLGKYAIKEFDGPIHIGGVGQSSTDTRHGIYKVNLPLHNNCIAQLSGVCLNEITSPFPTYPLHGKVRYDIHQAYVKSGGDIRNLPLLASSVGGEIDIMLGAKYLRYHPTAIFQLASGLTIYKSAFSNADGGCGVIGGPHEVFTKIEHQHHSSQDLKTFLSNQMHLYNVGIRVNPDVTMLHYKVDKDYHNNLLISGHNCHTNVTSRNEKIFNQVEDAGSEITYRCIKCRNCKDCKDHDSMEAISTREEVEQYIINQSVIVNIQERISSAKLPLLHNPEIKLADNKEKALKVYNQQVRKLKKAPKDRRDVIESEQKMQELGFVEYVKNLPQNQQQKLQQSKVHNFIPWRAVWNGNSISTPCRLVFDASQPTPSKNCLNDIVAKGTNNMNKLVEILIRWMTHKVGLHTDISKMYNSVKLHEDHWPLQRYIWESTLSDKHIPEEKIIKTLIYGVKSSGNQAERALRQTAFLSKEAYPDVYEIVTKDMYVDDCLSGEETIDEAKQRADELEIVLSRGGFSLKGFTFSGSKPNMQLSNNGDSINVAGMKWFPEEDVVSLDIGELNFAKKMRGKKPTLNLHVIPDKLTRRHCVAKVAEIFDLTGKITPITAAMKMDLHDLVERKLDWDDSIPDELRHTWENHFEMMKEISTVKFRRAVVPKDAVDLNIHTIDTADASIAITCAAIYARFLRRDGSYSCQLVFSRSKLVPNGTTQPRAELLAATLNAHTGESVKRSFKNYHASRIKLTDSQIALYWIHNDNKPLKPWVRNRVLEIRRLTSPDEWKYVSSSNMIADIGTRRGASLLDVSPESSWINGFQWMKNDENQFPTKSVDDIKIQFKDIEEEQQKVVIAESPILPPSTNFFTTSKEGRISEVQQRYQFSNYLIDPNFRRFRTVIRILAIVIKFIKLCQHRQISHPTTKSTNMATNNASNAIQMGFKLDDDDIKASENYFFKRCSLEVKHFLQKTKYNNITSEKEGILMYTGRILNTDDITIVGRFTNTMKDLSSSTFCVPVIDKYSPVAFALANDVHWHHETAKHCGVETTLRYILKTAYIIEGRSVVKAVKKSCERCRYLEKRTIAVEMGPVSQHNLTIAPAFFASQVDLAGPFLSYSNHYKRTTVKIWLVIFCCSTTSSTNIKVMEDYSTTSFIQAFTRFSCDVGYPSILLCDEGSQLVKACQEMNLNFRDIQHKLHKEVNVQFEVCPVGGHNEHGKVERRIKEVKISIEKSMNKDRLSIIQWETLASIIANSINNLPLAIGSITSDLENLDLITPNRLKLGRNNERSPIGPVVTAKPTRVIKENQRIFDCWFENWMLSHVPKLLKQQKWFRNDTPVKVDDIVLFLKQDGPISSDYKYGIVKTVEFSKDGLIRRALIQYRNENENVFRETFRSVRSIVVIHHVDEINLLKELGLAANKADVRYQINSK